MPRERVAPFARDRDVPAGQPEHLYVVHDALGSVVGLTNDPAALDALDPNYPGAGGSGGGAGSGGSGGGSGGGAGGGAGILPALVERYEYDPHGATYIACRDPNTYDDAGETRDPHLLTDSAAWQPCESSRFGNPFLWTAQRYDPAVRLYHFLFRTYSPTLGRWMQRDPAGHVDGVSLYEYVSSRPTLFVDSLGLKKVCGVDPWLFFGRWCVDEELYDAALDERAKDIHDRTQGTIDGVASAGTAGLTDLVGLNPGDMLGPTFDDDVRASAKNAASVVTDLTMLAISGGLISPLKNPLTGAG